MQTNQVITNQNVVPMYWKYHTIQPKEISRDEFNAAIHRQNEFPESSGPNAHLDAYLMLFPGATFTEICWIKMMDGGSSIGRLPLMPDGVRFLFIKPQRFEDKKHEMLDAFLGSQWTTDKAERTEARDAYSGSVEAWMVAVHNHNAIEAFKEFVGDMLEKRGVAWLRSRGIVPIWA
jgi:hypothetical protein